MSIKQEPKSADTPATTPLSRRTLFAGAGAVGALAAVAGVARLQAATAPVAEAVLPVADAAGGYQLTEHVKRYYQTARV
jgi:hypothetical protein